MLESKQVATVLLSSLWMLGAASKFLACSRQEPAAATPIISTVAPVSPSVSPAQHIFKVTVDERGFTPNGVTVKATEGAMDSRLLLEFTRVTDDTCVKKVLLPELDSAKDLPLNVPVQVLLPLDQRRQVSFRCAAGMHQGGIFID